MSNGYNQFSYPKKPKDTTGNEPGQITLDQGLPIILAGPIIKRAETDSVYIWICTSKKLKLGSRIYDGRANAEKIEINYPVFAEREQKAQNGYEQLNYLTGNNFQQKDISNFNIKTGNKQLGEGLGTTYTLGANIYITLVKVIPSSVRKFPTATELSYELFVLEKENNFTNAKLLFDKKERALITIDDNRVFSPTFCLQKNDSKDQNENLRDLRIAFGSCRKFHGEAEDCTTALFNEKYKNEKTTKRPNALFFLGDQIYSDDVSGVLIEHLNFKGKILLGEEDGLPNSTGLLFPSTIEKDGRQVIINDAAGFSSTAAANHLATLGEFYAMYLLAYNSEMWDGINLSISKVRDFLSPEYKGVQNKKNDEKNNKEIESLRNAKEGSRYMRKILANTPTYMICDDHEITDDWFITTEWKKTVSNNPLGSRIVTNGICAYWFFQWLGNDPINNEDSGEFLNSQLWEKLSQSRIGEATSMEDKDIINKCTDYNNWSYIAPTVPATMFLDTRFNRVNTNHPTFSFFHYESYTSTSLIGMPNGKTPFELDPTPKKSLRVDLIPNYGNDPEKFAPLLINLGQLDRMATQLTAYNINNGIIFATPAPIFGLECIEILLEFFYSMNKDKDNFMKVEREAWSCNPYSIDLFVSFLKNIFKNIDTNSKENNFKILILSGDVHYSYFNNVTISTKGTNKNHDLSISMLTSSGIKNPMDVELISKINGQIQKIINQEAKFYQNRKYDSDNVNYELEISEYGRTESEYTLTYQPENLTNYCKKEDVDVGYYWRTGTFGFLNGKKIEFIIPK